MKKKGLLLITLIALSISAFSQRKDTSIFAFPIQMDEVVVKAMKNGFDVAGFIKRVKEDTTFYKAFRTLHIVPYTSINDIRIYGKNSNVIASLSSTTKQSINGRCRSMQTVQEKITGDFYKRNGDYRYYTAELYAYLFFTKKPVCGENNIVAGMENHRGSGQMEKRKWQLKQLIFNPGSKVGGIPFGANKAAIFEPDAARMYDFRLLSVEYDGEDCYLFSALPKKQYKDDVIYNELSTWFRKSDYSIVARDYSLSYKTMLYDFDVVMKVRLKNINGRLLPSRIDYRGNWHVATQSRERASFTTVLTY
jgi:hypothetical protein